MQHHGAPTRHLDWTASPYVAAYFAAHHEGQDADGAIWCFCSTLLKQSFEENHDSLPDFEIDGAAEVYERALKELSTTKIVVPLEFNYLSSERMFAQQGRFTMCFNISEQHDRIADCVKSSMCEGS